MAEELNIGIKVTADTAGAKQAESALQGVGRAAEKAGGGFKGIGSGGQAVAQHLNQAGGAANQAAGAFGGLGRSAAATGNVINGLSRASQGGIESLKGLFQAAKGAGQIFQTGFGGVAGVFSVITAGLGLVQLGLNKWVDTARKDLVDAYAKAAAESNKLKEAQAERAKAATAELDKEIAQIKQLATEFQKYLDLVDKTSNRNDKVDDAARELELSTATTDEQRDAINERFDGAAAENKGLRAGLKKDAALQTQRAAQAKIDQAGVDLGLAERAPISEGHQERIAQARAALAAAQEEGGKVFSQTQEVIDDATTEQSVAKTRGQAQKNRTAERNAPKIVSITGPAAGATGPELVDTSRLTEGISSAQAERDAIDAKERKGLGFTLGDSPAKKLVAQKDQEIAAMREMLTATEAKNAEAVAQFKKGAKSEKKTTEQIKNARPGS